MTQPAVTITETDNALGVLPDSEGALLALIGTSTSGPLNMPATYGRTKSFKPTSVREISSKRARARSSCTGARSS